LLCSKRSYNQAAQAGTYGKAFFFPHGYLLWGAPQNQRRVWGSETPTHCFANHNDNHNDTMDTAASVHRRRIATNPGRLYPPSLWASSQLVGDGGRKSSPWGDFAAGYLVKFQPFFWPTDVNLGREINWSSPQKYR